MIIAAFSYIVQIVYLIGNKLDLQDSREVSIEEGIKFKEKFNLFSYLEISSKTGKSVEELFNLIAKIILKEIQFERYEKKEEKSIFKIFKELKQNKN